MDAKNTVVEYIDPLANDEQLRQRLAAAMLAGAAAKRRIRQQTGIAGVVRRIATDTVLREQAIEIVTQLQAAQRRAKKARSHKLRNTVLFAGGVAMIVAAVPSLREKAMSLVGGDDEGGIEPAEI